MCQCLASTRRNVLPDMSDIADKITKEMDIVFTCLPMVRDVLESYTKTLGIESSAYFISGLKTCDRPVPAFSYLCINKNLVLNLETWNSNHKQTPPP